MAGAALQGSLRERAVITLRGVATLTIIAAAYAYLRRSGYVSSAPGPLFALGFLLVAGTVAGTVAAFFRLPRLTGYLVAGMLVGPHGLHIIDHAAVSALSLINALALALIALEAGAELTVASLGRNLKSLLWQSLTHTFILGTGMAVSFFALAHFGFIDFLAGSSTLTVLAAAAVWGAFATSKSPAATLAILKETRARGPVSEVSLGVVVLFDVIVLVLFAAAVMFAHSVMSPSGGLSLDTFTALGVELVASVAAGVTFGLCVALYFFAFGKEPLLFLLVTAYGVTAFCTYFHYDTLLVFAVAGFVVTNMSRQGERLVRASEQMGSAVMVVFFATAGAHLDLEVLKSAWVVALALAVGRMVLTWVSSAVAHRAARDAAIVRRFTFTSLISQAGVAIGLATIAAESLEGIGAGVATMAIAVVGINEMIGPIVFKIGLARAGELGQAADHEEPHDAAPEPAAAP